MFEYTLHHILVRHVEGESRLSSKTPNRVKNIEARDTLLAILGAPESASLDDLDAALTTLSAAPLSFIEETIKASAEVVISDNKVSVEEAELLRVIGDALGCPVPVFLPS